MSMAVTLLTTWCLSASNAPPASCQPTVEALAKYNKPVFDELDRQEKEAYDKIPLIARHLVSLVDMYNKKAIFIQFIDIRF